MQEPTSLQTRDNAGELRVEIAGRFAGATVETVSQLWNSILEEKAARSFTIDITNLSSYDLSGCRLLRAMHHHGVRVAAASSASLIFLAEISAPAPAPPTPIRSSPDARAGRVRALASGE
jgi:hypothetical protein